MLTLIYGTRGARGEIYNRIKEDFANSRRAYLIVPDQKALLAESALMNILPKSAALTVDAVGFSRLANLVCRRYGSLTYTYATNGAKVLFVYRAIKKLRNLLTVFGGEVKSGTLKALCTLFSEFRSCSVSASDLYDAANAMPHSPLSDKLLDMSLIFEEYETLLHEQFAEHTDDLDTLADLLCKNDFFGDARVYIDSFVSFTKQEMRIISAMLSHGTNVCIALPYARGDCAETLPHLAECADTRRRLLKVAAKLSATFEEVFTSDISPDALVFAKENVWNFASDEVYPQSTRGVLEVCECADCATEAELCASGILELVQNGADYSDIAIIARSASDYTGILDRLFDRCDIPVFFSEKKDALLLPLTKLILSALSMYIYDFRESDVAAYIKTGLSGLDDDECDLFEEYINRWKINGAKRYLGEDFTMSKDGYTSADIDISSLDDVNSCRRKIALPLSRFCDTLSGARTVKEMAAAVYGFLDEANIPDASTSPEFTKYFGADSVNDSIRLWNVTMDALDTLVTAAGDEYATVAEFYDLVRLLFDSIDIGRIPSSLDQVIFGSADTIRIDERKYIYIIGVNEGAFPAPVPESPTLGESERKILFENGVELSQNRELRSSRELYHFVRALDFASQRVTVSYHRNSSDGMATDKSFAVERLIQIFGDSLCRYKYSDLPLSDRARSAALAEDNIGLCGKESEKVLSAVLSPLGRYLPPLKYADELCNTRASITEESAKKLCGDKMNLSQTRLDTFGNCRLRYFLQYATKLSDTEPFVFDAADTGTFVHSVLEQFINEIIEKKARMCDITDEEIDEAAERLCKAETERVMRSCNGGSARMLSFFTRMKSNVRLILRNMRREFADSSFDPFICEYKIGRGGHEPYTVTLSDGSTAVLNGVADRIDICRTNGKTYLKICDYKTGDKTFAENDVFEGKNLQLLIYLLTLCKVADKGFFKLLGVNDASEIAPAGACYYVVRTPRVTLESPPSDDGDVLKAADGKLCRKGFILTEDNVTGLMEHSASKEFTKGLFKKDLREIDDMFIAAENAVRSCAVQMRGGDLNCESVVSSTAHCNTCEFADICRINGAKGDASLG